MGARKKEKQLLAYPSGCNRWCWQPKEYFDPDDDDDEEDDDNDANNDGDDDAI